LGVIRGSFTTIGLVLVLLTVGEIDRPIFAYCP
jgi:hypothetical protein